MYLLSKTKSLPIFLLFFSINILFLSQSRAQQASFTKMNIYHFKSDSLFENRESLNLKKFLRWKEEYDDKGRLIEADAFSYRITFEYGEEFEIRRYYDKNDTLEKYFVRDKNKRSDTHFRVDSVKNDTFLVSIKDTILCNDSLVIFGTYNIQNRDTLYSNKTNLYIKNGIVEREEVEQWNEGEMKNTVYTTLRNVHSKFFSTAQKVCVENGDTISVTVSTDIKDPKGYGVLTSIISSNKGGYPYSMTKYVKYSHKGKPFRMENYSFKNGKWNLCSTQTKEYDEFGRLKIYKTINEYGNTAIDYYEYE